VYFPDSRKIKELPPVSQFDDYRNHKKRNRKSNTQSKQYGPHNHIFSSVHINTPHSILWVFQVHEIKFNA